MGQSHRKKRQTGGTTLLSRTFAVCDEWTKIMFRRKKMKTALSIAGSDSFYADIDWFRFAN